MPTAGHLEASQARKSFLEEVVVLFRNGAATENSAGISGTSRTDCVHSARPRQSSYRQRGRVVRQRKVRGLYRYSLFSDCTASKPRPPATGDLRVLNRKLPNCCSGGAEAGDEYRRQKPRDCTGKQDRSRSSPSSPGVGPAKSTPIPPHFTSCWGTFIGSESISRMRNRSIARRWRFTRRYGALFGLSLTCLPIQTSMRPCVWRKMR